MMEVAFKNQREAVEKEQSEGQEEASMLARCKNYYVNYVLV
jgi:hypothetical protein